MPRWQRVVQRKKKKKKKKNEREESAQKKHVRGVPLSSARQRGSRFSKPTEQGPRQWPLQYTKITAAEWDGNKRGGREMAACQGQWGLVATYVHHRETNKKAKPSFLPYQSSICCPCCAAPIKNTLAPASKLQAFFFSLMCRPPLAQERPEPCTAVVVERGGRCADSTDGWKKRRRNWRGEALCWLVEGEASQCAAPQLPHQSLEALL